MSTNRWKNVFKEYKWVLLLLLLTVAVNTVEISEEYDKSELIRFHVLADNDSPQAQADKLAVKDAVAAFMQKELADSGKKTTAKVCKYTAGRHISVRHCWH